MKRKVKQSRRRRRRRTVVLVRSFGGGMGYFSRLVKNTTGTRGKAWKKLKERALPPPPHPQRYARLVGRCTLETPKNIGR
jgi:hypothetical protein